MTEARIIDGKAFAAALRARVTAGVARITAEHGLVPGVATVLVGEDPASQVYVRNKRRLCEEAGMVSLPHTLAEDTSEADLLGLVARLNADAAVNGILVQLPLPDHIAVDRVVDAVDPTKDVDGFHPLNAGLLAAGRPGLVPCTPFGCMLMLRHEIGDLSGLDAVVVGRSNIVGKPIAMLLLQAHCTVTMAHSRTRDLAGLCRRADILVAAVGRARMIEGDWIKPGSVIIDVGINRIEQPGGKTRLVGDVDFEAARHVAGAITPVPGGVGPMTIACLLRNTLVAACHQHGIEAPAVDTA